jgi:hypothetical protein
MFKVKEVGGDSIFKIMDRINRLINVIDRDGFTSYVDEAIRPIENERRNNDNPFRYIPQKYREPFINLSNKYSIEVERELSPSIIGELDHEISIYQPNRIAYSNFKEYYLRYLAIFIGSSVSREIHRNPFNSNHIKGIRDNTLGVLGIGYILAFSIMDKFGLRIGRNFRSLINSYVFYNIPYHIRRILFGNYASVSNSKKLLFKIFSVNTCLELIQIFNILFDSSNQYVLPFWMETDEIVEHHVNFVRQNTDGTFWVESTTNEWRAYDGDRDSEI